MIEFVAASRRSPDPARIAAAQISGTVERCIVGHGLTEDQALVKIGACLGRLPEPLWPAVLASVASHHVDRGDTWHQAALQLLVRAGTNVEEARRRRDALPSGGYSGRFTH